MITVGNLLKKARTEKQLTLKGAEVQTKIRLRYLEAVEGENWSVFSSRVYITGVIQAYAKFLGIDPAKALAYFRRDYEKREDVTFKKKLPALQFLPETKKMIILSVSLVFFFFLLSYFGYQLFVYFSPPQVEILEPDKTTFRNTEKIVIIGKTKPESVIRIFNEELYPDENGIFRYAFPIKKGLNSLIIRVTGPNGRETIFTEQYTLE